MGIFHFGLDQKIPRDRDRGFRIPENPQKKSPKNRLSRGWGFGILEAKKSPKIPIRKCPEMAESQRWGFLNLGDIPDPRSLTPGFLGMEIFRGLGFFLVG